jgi:LPS-assembly lipoprotein
MKTNKTLVAAFTALSLSLSASACGFEPLYSTKNINGETSTAVIAKETSYISITRIPDRRGQILKNNLLEMLTPNGEPDSPKYELRVKLGDFPSIKQGLESDNTATRILINASAEYSLYDVNNPQKPILTGKARAKTSYNVLDEVYSSIVSKENAEERALGIIAENIALRLGVYFRNK